MSVISNFYGIIIKMYFRESEHNPHYIHTIYNEYVHNRFKYIWNAIRRFT